MTRASPVGPFTVELDVSVTRRQRIHAVVDGDGTQIYHSKWIMEVFHWLLEQGVNEFTALDEDREFRVSLAKPLSAIIRRKG